ncbi:hypothetical protein [Sphingomonas sp. IW22]|uniref:hypothetical protein n=1 Tax=Sphingomonas sp. IW22 TaxID=3242489 RepID=UPI003522DAAD
MYIPISIMNKNGISFVVAIVNIKFLSGKIESIFIMNYLKNAFSGIPIVLVAKDINGRTKFFGRLQIVKLIRSENFNKSTWVRHNVQY